MKLVILITAKTEKGFEVARAWQTAGAPGVTIINAHGLHSIQKRLRQGTFELPRMIISAAAAMAQVFNDLHRTTYIFISVMPEEMIDDIIAETESILGDLLSPDTGVVFVLDVERAIGVRNHGTE